MFTSKLKNVVESIQGGEAAILMGFDGIPVDSFEVDNRLDIETVGMEFSVVLKEIFKAAELLDTGLTEEVIVSTDKTTTIVRIVNDGYFLAFTLKSSGNTGKARYALRILAPELNQDLI